MDLHCIYSFTFQAEGELQRGHWRLSLPLVASGDIFIPDLSLIPYLTFNFEDPDCGFGALPYLPQSVPSASPSACNSLTHTHMHTHTGLLSVGAKS